MVDDIGSRQLGSKTMPQQTPLNMIKVGELPNPSKLESDQTVLANLSLKGEMIGFNLDSLDRINPEAIVREKQPKDPNPYDLFLNTVPTQKRIPIKRVLTAVEMKEQNKKRFKLMGVRRQANSINRVKNDQSKIVHDYLKVQKEER